MNKFYIQKECVENAVFRVSNEISLSKKQASWKSLKEEKLWLELVSCILGSRVQDELAKSFVKKLRSKGLLNRRRILKAPKKMTRRISNELNTPTSVNKKNDTRKRYPYSKLRATHIVQSCISIYSGTYGGLKKLLGKTPDAYEARNILIELCMGIGPKQASLFLRNISYSEDLAIFDSHVIRFMRLIGLIKENIRILSKRQYLEYEKILIAYSKLLDKTLAILDFAIWIVMKVIWEDREFYGNSCSYVRRH